MRLRYSFLTLSAFVLVLSAVPSWASAQTGTIYLNDGSVLTGQVIEFAPGDHVTLQIGTTAPIVIPQASIARVEIGQAAPQQPYGGQPAPGAPPPYGMQQQGAQAYQLQQPYQAPPPRRPGLGLPITFMVMGVVLAGTGGALIALSNDIFGNEDLLYYGVGFTVLGGVALGLGIVSLVMRIKQRKRWSREHQAQPQYSLAPIFAPRSGHFGLQGQVSF